MVIHFNRKYKLVYPFLITGSLNSGTLLSFHFSVSRHPFDQLRYGKSGRSQRSWHFPWQFQWNECQSDGDTPGHSRMPVAITEDMLQVLAIALDVGPGLEKKNNSQKLTKAVKQPYQQLDRENPDGSMGIYRCPVRQTTIPTTPYVVCMQLL